MPVTTPSDGRFRRSSAPIPPEIPIPISRTPGILGVMDFESVQGLIREGYSRRKIAVLLKMSRNTIKKYLHPSVPLPYRGADGRGAGKLKPYLDILNRLLDQNPAARSIAAFRLLKENGYAGGYDLVRKRIREIRNGRSEDQETEKPLPGQRAEVDIGAVRAAGMPYFLFSMKLAHSERVFAVLLEKPDQDSFLECHRQAFRFFRGAPAEIVYGLRQNKWLRRLVGAAPFHLPLVRFSGHYRFAIREAPALAPWSHNRLYRPARIVQSGFLTGFPPKDLQDTNAALASWLCARENARWDADAETRRRHEREQAALRSLPMDSPPVLRLKLKTGQPVIQHR